MALPTTPGVGEVFYPGMAVSFQIRFDEAFHTDDSSPDPNSSQGLAQGSGGSANQPRLAPKPLFSNAAKDKLTTILNRVPKSASIELTGFRQAGTFKLTFDYRDLPIDPRLVRSASVAIHLDSVPAKRFSDGMGGLKDKGAFVSGIDANAGNLVIAGQVDTWHVNHDDGSSVIEMEGRDLRQIFLDSPLPIGWEKKIDLNHPLDNVVKQILDIHPLAGELNITVQPDDWKGSSNTAIQGPGGQSFATILPSPAAKDLIPRHRQGANGDRALNGQTAAPDQMNFWDLITKLCFLVGGVPFFLGSKLIIRPVRSISDQMKAGIDPSVKTPFADGKQRSVPGNPGIQFSIRKLVYGRDVRNMTFERKYTGFKPKIVRCVSIDTSSTKRGGNKIVEAIYPNQEELTKLIAVRLGNTPDAQKLAKQQSQQTMAKLRLVNGKLSQKTSVSPSGRESEQELLNIPVPGIKDVGRLREIARSIWEEIGRGEMGGSVRTRSLSSFGGNNQDPDLLKLKPGDGVELEIDTRELTSSGPLVSFLIESLRKSPEGRIKEVDERFGQGTPLGDQNIARAVVAAAQGSIVELQKFFRVSNVKFDWSNTSGISIAFDYQNYVLARNEVTPSTGQNTSAQSASTSTNNSSVRPHVGII